MTASVSTTLSTAETIFKSLVWDPMVTAGIALLDTAQAGIPVLNIPVIESLEGDALKAVTDALFNSLVLFIDVESIALINDAAQSAYSTASEQLKIIAQEQGVNSSAFQTAQAAAIAALSQFTHFSGA